MGEFLTATPIPTIFVLLLLEVVWFVTLFLNINRALKNRQEQAFDAAICHIVGSLVTVPIAAILYHFYTLMVGG